MSTAQEETEVSSAPRPRKAPAPWPPQGLSQKAARALRLYREERERRFAGRTRIEAFGFLRAFIRWLEARQLDLLDVRPDDIVAYQSAFYAGRKKDGKPYAAATHSTHLHAIKSLYGFLSKRGYLVMNPAASLEFPRRENRIPRLILTPREVKRLIEAPDTKTPVGLRDRAILETFYATGIRASELAYLTPDDVDTEDRILRVVLGKGAKDRNLPLTRSAAEAIETYLLKGRPCFVSGKKSRYLFLNKWHARFYRHRLAELVRHWAERAGIKKHVTCHTIRHSFATHLLKGGADIRHIQALLGHATLSSTERYTRVEVSDLKKVLERSHPRGR